MNRCKNCKYFKRYTGKYDNNNYGRCQSKKLLYGETTEDKVEFLDEKGIMQETEETDLLLCMDRESYYADIEVGQDFGCIHYEEAKQ